MVLSRVTLLDTRQRFAFNHFSAFRDVGVTFARVHFVKIRSITLSMELRAMFGVKVATNSLQILQHRNVKEWSRWSRKSPLILSFPQLEPRNPVEWFVTVCTEFPP